MSSENRSHFSRSRYAARSLTNPPLTPRGTPQPRRDGFPHERELERRRNYSFPCSLEWTALSTVHVLGFKVQPIECLLLASPAGGWWAERVGTHVHLKSRALIKDSRPCAGGLHTQIRIRHHDGDIADSGQRRQDKAVGGNKREPHRRRQNTGNRVQKRSIPITGNRIMQHQC